MAQKLQSLLPLLQQKQAMEKQEAEKTKQRDETMGYLETVMGKYSYQPEEINQFKAETAAMPTEQLGNYFNMYHSGRTAKQDLNTWGINAEGMDLNQVGKLHDYTSKAIQLGDEGLAEYKKSIEAKEAPEVAYAKAAGLVAQQEAQAKRNEYLFQQANKKFSPKSGGGTGGGSKPDKLYTTDKKKVYYETAVDEGRLYFTGGGGADVYYTEVYSDDEGQLYYKDTDNPVTREELKKYKTKNQMDKGRISRAKKANLKGTGGDAETGTNSGDFGYF